MDKKELNKLYYETHKVEIAEKLYRKETCDCCGRVVSHQNMVKHKKTTYCTKKASIAHDNELLNKVKSNMDIYNTLETLLKTLK